MSMRPPSVPRSTPHGLASTKSSEQTSAPADVNAKKRKEQVKVSLAFQLGKTGSIARRKKVLSFKGGESLHKIYEIIAGRAGPALWPKSYANMMEEGYAASILYFEGTGDEGKWKQSPPSTKLWQVGTDEPPGGAKAQLLLRLEDPESWDPADAEYRIDPSVSADQPTGNARMKVQKTFLHMELDEGENGALSPRAHSDPGSCCGTVSEFCGSLREEASEELKRRHQCEEYIQKNLMPFLGRSDENGDRPAADGEQPQPQQVPQESPPEKPARVRLSTQIKDLPAYDAPSLSAPRSNAEETEDQDSAFRDQPIADPVQFRDQPIADPVQAEVSNPIVDMPQALEASQHAYMKSAYQDMNDFASVNTEDDLPADSLEERSPVMAVNITPGHVSQPICLAGCIPQGAMGGVTGPMPGSHQQALDSGHPLVFWNQAPAMIRGFDGRVEDGRGGCGGCDVAGFAPYGGCCGGDTSSGFGMDRPAPIDQNPSLRWDRRPMGDRAGYNQNQWMVPVPQAHQRAGGYPQMGGKVDGGRLQLAQNLGMDMAMGRNPMMIATQDHHGGELGVGVGRGKGRGGMCNPRGMDRRVQGLPAPTSPGLMIEARSPEPEGGWPAQHEAQRLSRVDPSMDQSWSIAPGRWVPNNNSTSLSPLGCMAGTAGSGPSDSNMSLVSVPRQAELGLSPFDFGNVSLEEVQNTSRPELLFNAVTRGDIDVVRALINANVELNMSTERGSHVLFRAVMKAQGPDIVRLLVESTADVRCMDEKGNSVMHFWARATVGRNHLVEIGKCLVDAKADVNAQRSMDGMSPLHHVAVGHNNRRGWLDFHKALFLLRHNARPAIVTHWTQTPRELLNKDNRASTKKMAHVLQHGLGPGIRDWPTCEHHGCVWCA